MGVKGGRGVRGRVMGRRLYDMLERERKGIEAMFEMKTVMHETIMSMAIARGSGCFPAYVSVNSA